MEKVLRKGHTVGQHIDTAYSFDTFLAESAQFCLDKRGSAEVCCMPPCSLLYRHTLAIMHKQKRGVTGINTVKA